MEHGARARIASIVIEQLFGYLTYEIPTRLNEDLIVVYGDNGSGKTTLLNLIFHALAPNDNQGHRTHIAKIPFKRMEIDFEDGHRIHISRDKANVGPFTMSVGHKNRDSISHSFILDKEGRVREQDKSTYQLLLKALSDLNLGLFLLPDNRQIQSNLYEDEEVVGRSFYLTHYHSHKFEREREYYDEDVVTGSIDDLVKLALKRSTQWIRRQALAATSQGETDTNKIYTEILRRISGHSSAKKQHEKMSFEKLLEKAESLSKRSTTFSRFGLVTSLRIRKLLPDLKGVSAQKKGVITQVLSPYIRSFEARLDALEKLREALDTFSEIFSRFYQHKKLSINMERGIRIELSHGEDSIDPEVLSSGEKQLLLLFCNVMLARSRPSVFIIDEPELSLNIKWQRELVSALMACVRGCDVQFLIATHSLEMIARHKGSAVRLESMD